MRNPRILIERKAVEVILRKNGGPTKLWKTKGTWPEVHKHDSTAGKHDSAASSEAMYGQTRPDR